MKTFAFSAFQAGHKGDASGLCRAHFEANGELEMVPAVEAAGGVSGGAFPSAHRSNLRHFIS
jgi:hypothetical protein